MTSNLATKHKPERRQRRSLLARFRRAEDGAVTIPAVLFLPLFIMIMAASVELCVLAFKQTLMERGVSLSARVMQLGMSDLPDHTTLKRSVCQNIAFLRNCMDDLRVEVFEVDKTTWSSSRSGTSATCVDRSDVTQPDPDIEGGASDQLMIMRACLMVEPMMMVNPLARALVQGTEGEYALVTITSFVNEPRI